MAPPNHVWLRATATSISLVLLGAIIALIAVFLVAQGRNPFPPQLHDMPSVITDVAPEFQRRLDDAFPVGMSEQELIAGLSAWGFEFRLNNRRQLWANLDVPSFLCTEGFSVEWVKDAAEIVIEIVGDYHPSCL